ncbi:unnamed protein product [Brassica oleracea]|uniref:RING-type E3 ubiquitin transferase n=3 Tax=Brassica TaxID=3705 RepID=A0A816JSA7_BRANA|nr:unnamed protein product [Brassica napus]
MRRLTACGHCFHAECIDPWLEERSTCPECRAHIPPVPPEYPLIALVVPPTSFCVNFITFSLRKLQRFSRMFAESLISFSQLIAETFIIASLSVFSLRLFLRLASFLVSRPWRRYRTFTVHRRRRWRKKTAEPYCPICLQDAAEGEKMRRLTACGHCFHAECIDPWLEKRSTCPQCRAQIPPVPPEYPLVALFVPPGVIELFTKEP